MNKFVKRALATTLSVVLTVNPALATPPPQLVHHAAKNAQAVALAAQNTQALGGGIVVDPALNSERTGVKQAANGTAVIDIATPSAKGVSHNQFTEFNVDEAGVILNNSAAPVLTQLGGWSDGNRRLAGGEAKIILSEVTGANLSSLQGQLEIAGKSAAFVLANANGITCNGCGFINTPRVSLVTGNPVFGADGSLGFNVGDGSVLVEGHGLNASAIDRFDIITRSAQINASIYAKELNFFAGSNHYDYDSNDLTAINPSSAHVQFALDSSALGGMYANSIRLLGTEKGVGVNTQGLIQSVTDLELTADGDIRVKDALAGNKLQINSTSGNVAAGTRVYGKQVNITASESITNSGLLAAESAITLSGRELQQQGDLYAGLHTSGKLADSGSLSATISENFSNKGTVFVASDLHLSTPSLVNSGLFSLQSEQTLNGMNSLSNQGTLQFNTQNNVAIVTDSIDNSDGEISLSGKGALNISIAGDLNNTGGKLSAAQALHVDAANINNAQGLISAEQLALNTGELINSQGVLQSNQLTLDAAILNNREGAIYSLGKESVSWSIAGVFDNTQGEVYSNTAAATVSAAELDNTQGNFIFNTADMNITLNNNFINQQGLFQAGSTKFASGDFNNNEGKLDTGSLALTAKIITNDAGFLQTDSADITAENYRSKGGVLLAKDSAGTGFNLQLSQQLNNSLEAIIRSLGGEVQISAKEINNSDSAITHSGTGKFSLTADKLNNHGGTFTANNQLLFNVKELHNNQGTIQAADTELAAETIDNSSGIVQSTQGNLLISAAELDNSQGVIAGAADTTLTLDHLFNNSEGIVKSQGHLQLDAQQINNQAGELTSQTLHIATQQLSNIAGSVTAGEISLTLPELDNSQGMIAATQIGGKGLQLSVTGSLSNSSGTLLSKGTQLQLAAGQLNNAKGNIIAEEGLLLATAKQSVNNSEGLIQAANNIEITTESINNNSGELVAGDRLSITSRTLDNSNGLVLAKGSSDNSLRLVGQVTNQGGRLESFARNLTFDNIILDNQQGIVNHLGEGSLSLTSAGSFNNNSGIVQSKGDLIVLATAADSQINNQAGLLKGKSVDLTASALIDNSSTGTIEGNRLVLSAHHINNAAGHLVATGTQTASMEFNTATSIDNRAGELRSSAKDWALDLDLFDNTSGIVAHTGSGSLTLNSNQALINSGIISSKANLLVNAKGLQNSGQLLADNNLTLTASAAINNATAGLIKAGSDLQIIANGFDLNNQGEISSGTGLDISLGDGTLNSSGTIITSADSAILSQAEFNNSGLFVHNGAGTVSITADSFTNSHTLQSAQGTLNLNAATFANSGMLSVRQLQVSGVGEASNSQRIEADQITFNGKSFNNSGTLAAIGSVDSLNLWVQDFTNIGKVTSNSLNQRFHGALINTGSIEHAGSGSLQLGDSGLVSDSGTIATAGIAYLVNELAGAGELFAKLGIVIDGAQFTNQSASIYTQGDITISSALTNGGTLLADGKFSLLTQGDVNNNGGTLQGRNLTIASNSLSNQAGVITSTGAGIGSINSQHAINNHGGTIAASNSEFTIAAAEGVDNTQGLITQKNSTAQTAGLLTIKAATQIDNTKGTLVAEGKLSIDAGNKFINHQATLGGDSLSLQATIIDNTLGTVSIAGVSDTNITGASLDNTGGAITANSDKVTLALAGLFTNNSGQFNHAGSGDLLLTAADMTTDATSKLLSNGNLALTLSSDLYNNGEIGAQRNNTITAHNLTNSSTGTIHSTHGLVNLKLDHFDLINSGGLSSQHQLKINAKTMSNSGTVGADQAIDIAVNGFNGVGNIASNNSLTITLVDSLVLQAGESLIAPNSLSINTQGGFDNSGTLSAANDLTLAGKYLNNFSTGKIIAGSGVGSSFTIEGDILNQGKISIQQNLAIKAFSMINDKHATIVTGGNLTFDVDDSDSIRFANFINRNIIYAAGEISITKSENIFNEEDAILLSGKAMDLHTTGDISNINGRIEAASDMTLQATGNIQNGFKTPTLVTTSLPGEETIVSSIYNGSNNGAMYDFTFRSKNITEYTISDFNNFNSKILAGNNLTLAGGSDTIINNNYGSIFAAADLVVNGKDLINLSVTEKTEETIVTRAAGYAASCVTSNTVIDPNCTAQYSTAPTAAPTTTSYQRSLGSIHVGGNISGNLTGKITNGGNDLDLLGNKPSAELPDVRVAILVDGSRAQNVDPDAGPYHQAQGRAANPTGDTRKLNSQVIGDKSTAGNGSSDGIAGAASSNKILETLAVAPGSDPDAAIQEQLRDLPNLLLKANPLPGATLALPVISFSVLPINFNLNNLSGFYVIAQSPDSHYLIETRPEFTSYERFIGSDYLLAALGYDPEQTIKRLGDAFFETQLVKDALMAEVTTRYLDGETNDFEQMQHLMDNAVNAYQHLQLTLGVALTPEQSAALTQDMIWMVQKTVNGEKVLVPQLYLTSVSQEKLLASKAAIGAAGDITLASTGEFLNNNSIAGGGNIKLSSKGDFKQTGMVVARGDITFIADQVLINSGVVRGNNVELTAQERMLNSGTVNAQRELSLKAKGDIVNQQGVLEGNDVSLQSTEGSIVNRTEFSQNTHVDRQGRRSTYTDIGPASTIISHNSLMLDANKDLDLQGSKFSAANDINFTAGQDILLNAIEDKTAIDNSYGKRTIKHNSTQFQEVEINAGGNLQLNAGRDLVAEGSQLNAGGDADVTAGRDINFTAMANSTHSEDLTKRKKFIDSETIHTLVNINSGGNTNLHAGQDANLTGVTINAEGSVALGATRDTNVSAVVDSNYHYDSVTKKKSFGRSKTTTNETFSEELVGGTVNSGGDLLINAHKNADGKIIGEASGAVNLEGVNFTAKNDVAISADEDVNITGMQYETLDYHASKKSGAFGLSKKDKGLVANDSHLQNASIEAGGNAHVLAGTDINLAATNVVVNGNIDLQAIDNLLITAGEAVNSSREWSNKSGVFSGGDLYRKAEHKAGEGVAEAQASNLVAGGHIVASTGTGQVVGSTISGAAGVTLISDTGDFDILSASTTNQAYSHNESVSVGLEDVGKALSRPDELIKTKNGRTSIKLADAQFDSADNKSTATSTLQSAIKSEQNVTVIAKAGKVTVQGSTIAADSDNNQSGTLGLAGATGVNITEANNTYNSEAQETHGKAELSVVVQNQAVEVVNATKAVDDAKEQLDQAKKDYKAYERNLDQLETQLGQLESDYANKAPGVAYEDLLELREIVSESKSDKEWYQAGIALAAVNVTSSVTALLQQTKTLANSSGTYGFNAGLQLDVDASKTTTTDSSTTAQASHLSGNKILIQTGTVGSDGNLNREGTQTTIRGSHLAATDDITIQTGELNLLNSVDTSEHTNKTERSHVTTQLTVYGASGGASVNGSIDRSKERSTSTTINNTTLNADKINLHTTGDANLLGATVHADSVLTTDIKGDLNLASQQDRSHSNNNSAGVSGGFSLGGNNITSLDKAINGNALTKHIQGPSNVGDVSRVNGGINVSNGTSMTRETVLTSLTSGGTADVKVKGNTHIAGALIGTIDDHGNDLGNLDFDTGSLTFTDMRNIYKNSQTGGGISSDFTTGDVKAGQENPRAGQTIAEGADGEILHANTSNLTYNNEQANNASKTLATLGRGTIAVDGIQLEQNGELTNAGKASDSPLLLLNRDAIAAEKELWKSEETQTVDATLDHRLVSGEGWSDIKQDVNEIYNGMASLFSDIDPTLKEQTGETGSRAYDAIRQLGISDENTNAMLRDPKLIDILSRLENAEITLAQGDGQASGNAPSSSDISDQAPSVRPPGAVEEIVITGKSLEQTATEDAVVALNDFKNYVGEIRETNPKTAVALETSISVATGGAVVTAVGKGIEYGLAKSGMAEEVGKQISKVTDPIIEAGANGIERYDLSGEEFHDAVVEEGQAGNAASIKGGTGFFVGAVLGVGGTVLGAKSVLDGKAAREAEASESKNVNGTAGSRDATRLDEEMVGQPYHFDPKSFSEGRTLKAEDVNMSHTNGMPTEYPPYKNGTIVKEYYLEPGEKFYSVEFSTQQVPGGWATPKQYASLDEARAELALLPEFKSHDLVLREYTVIKPAPVRQGTVGELTSSNGKTYGGGGTQMEILFSRGTKEDPKWKEYLSDPIEYELEP